jgi:release factor glutamine methyltransferase
MKTQSTIIEEINKAHGTFQQASLASPRCEAELLIEDIVKIHGNELYLYVNNTLSEIQKQQYENRIHRRILGEPTQYITGYAYFYGLKLEVFPGVFIPRPETETLLESILDWHKNLSPIRDVRLMEIGYGTGNISIALALSGKNIQVEGFDISEAAYKCALVNSKEHNVSNQINYFNDSWDVLLKENKRFDAIYSNPPYIRSNALLPKEIIEHEPSEALFSGEDGLSIIRQIICESSKLLKEKGKLFLEIGDYEQAKEIKTNIAPAAGLRTDPVINDLTGKVRVIVFSKIQ